MEGELRALAGEIDGRLRSPDAAGVDAQRKVRRTFSKLLRERSGADVRALAHLLLDGHRWVAYELVHHHPAASAMLDQDEVERLGAGLDSWGAVDAFGRYVAGPAWQRRQLPDDAVPVWAASPDRWWRRAALVATVPLNLRAAGGTGDTARTLLVCHRLVDDRDDMVVKALSWALRELVIWDPEAVRGSSPATTTASPPASAVRSPPNWTTGGKNARRT
jgi:3-methyladenine DNA glycosylase AlkD